jgi:hypothetical protein
MLCVHGSKHYWERLSWMADVAELSQIPRGLDWAAAGSRARALGAERMMHLGLALAHELLAAPLPPEVLRRVRNDGAACSLAARVRARFFQEAGGPPGAAERLWFRFQMRGSLWEGAHYVLRLATAPMASEQPGAGHSGPRARLDVVLRPFRRLRG